MLLGVGCGLKPLQHQSFVKGQVTDVTHLCDVKLFSYIQLDNTKNQ